MSDTETKRAELLAEKVVLEAAAGRELMLPDVAALRSKSVAEREERLRAISAELAALDEPRDG